MPTEGIRAEELPRWVPGDVVLASDTLGWPSVKLRAYRYTPLDVEVPALQDFMVVAYRRGPTAMDRRFDGRWRHEDLIPGDVSLLTRAKPSHWHWTSGIEVIHVYLTARMMRQVCEEVFERQMVDVQLRDVLRARDPVLFNGALGIAGEAATQQLGGTLYVDSLARQMCLHALRHYASVSFREAPAGGGLSARQARSLAEFIDAHLAEPLTIDRLAQSAGVSGYFLLRHFKARFGIAPHAHVLERRLERARQLLETGNLGVREIAHLSGFSDQPHLTRLFKRRYGATPAAFRKMRSPVSRCRNIQFPA